jgi:mono/diheme cytochrome c family protein
MVRSQFALGAALVMLCAAPSQAAFLVGDSAQGAAIFKSQKCVACHSINGEGGKTAPDLGKRSARGYTPVEMAALMWNHAPQMWADMNKSGIAIPKISPEQAADLFAFFYSTRYFDKPGDAGRGRKLFASKGCSDCHNLTAGSPSPGTSVTNWQSVTDPIELARAMWNHSAKMRAAMESKGVKPPELTAAEMNDIVIYLQNLPQTRNTKAQFAPASAETGEMLFRVKGCAKCHSEGKGIIRQGIFQTSSDFAAAMWDHASKMGQLPELRPEEMKRIVGYVWAMQFAQEGGNAQKGAKVYEAKGCAGCHNSGVGPKMAVGAQVSSYELVSALWGHGPAMLQTMNSKGKQWPKFDNEQMADLLAYLKSK